ncbi:MAG: DUF819 family protein [Pseudomonadota bacterium]
MEASLIHSNWPFALWAVLALLATFGFWADSTKLGKNISGVALIMAVAMALSNFNILPKSSGTYDIVWSYLVPLAIPLLLLKADLRRVFSETGGMMIAFGFGALGSTVGAIIGFYIFPLGVEGANLAGVFSATYIGGSMNMAAVTQSVGLEPSIATASVAADNVIGVLYLTFLAIAPSIALIRWLFRGSTQYNNNSIEDENNNNKQKVVHLNLMHIGFALGLSFAICAVGKALAAYLGFPGYSIMFITAITLLIANIFHNKLKNIQGDYEIGLFFMYLFFAAIGISADVVAMFDKAIIIAVYALFIIVVHGLFIFGGSRLFKLELGEVIIASNACASGPASAAALAAGKGRHDLVVPAVLLGVFGYAVANFIGVMLAKLLAF